MWSHRCHESESWSGRKSEVQITSMVQEYYTMGKAQDSITGQHIQELTCV